MTRSSDRFVTLGNRVNFAKSRKADLFVAIHNNASLKKTDHGACVYYPNSGYKEEVGSEGKNGGSKYSETAGGTWTEK